MLCEIVPSGGVALDARSVLRIHLVLRLPFGALEPDSRNDKLLEYS